MKKSDVPSAVEIFSGMPLLESVKAKGKRTPAMHDIGRAHSDGVPVRRVFVELLDKDKQRLAREKGPGIRWRAEKSVRMAQSPVLIGKRITRRSSKNTSSSCQQSLSVCARETRNSSVRSR